MADDWLTSEPEPAAADDCTRVNLPGVAYRGNAAWVPCREPHVRALSAGLTSEPEPDAGAGATAVGDDDDWLASTVRRLCALACPTRSA